MKKSEVPQDQISSYQGHQKLAYALDEKGQYQGVKTSGWRAEEQVNQVALEYLEKKLQKTRMLVEAGKLSPLAFHMAKRQMDETLFAQTARVFRWRLRRHLRPEIFQRLKPHVLERYAKALDLSVDEIRTLPKDDPS